MSLISVVLVLIVIGMLVWLEETYLPVAAPFKTIIRVVIIIAVCLWLLGLVGLIPDLGAIRVGH